MSGVRWSMAALGALAAVAALAGACTKQQPGATAPTSTTTVRPTSTTVVSASRTVLSPVGIRVRAQPSKSAKVLGSAAQGVVLKVLGHTDASGGWWKVQGRTVTGWISADRALTAPGTFQNFDSAGFNTLYPATWTVSDTHPTDVVFKPAGPGQIDVRSAATTAKLPKGRTGYGVDSVRQVVVCGVTTALVTYQQATAGALPYLVEVRFAVDPKHALGVYGALPDKDASAETFAEFVASMSFPSPQCLG